jgi:hypothetical protein
MCSLCSDESQASLKRAIAIEFSVSLPHERIQFTKSQLLEEEVISNANPTSTDICTFTSTAGVLGILKARLSR